MVGLKLGVGSVPPIVDGFIPPTLFNISTPLLTNSVPPPTPVSEAPFPALTILAASLACAVGLYILATEAIALASILAPSGILKSAPAGIMPVSINACNVSCPCSCSFFLVRYSRAANPPLCNS